MAFRLISSAFDNATKFLRTSPRTATTFLPSCRGLIRLRIQLALRWSWKTAMLRKREFIGCYGMFPLRPAPFPKKLPLTRYSQTAPARG